MRLRFATIAILISSQAAFADTYVRGHTRQDGTWVQPHYRTDTDSSRLNNYSTQGNTNPYTGRAGTVDPYSPPNPFGSNNTNSGNNLYGSRQRWR
jgi:hypothetical protein